MLHFLKAVVSRALSQRVSGRTRPGRRRAAARPRARLAVEGLEDRRVPTVVINPTFGQENVFVAGNGSTATAALQKPPVYVIFEGQQWADPAGNPNAQATALGTAANQILKSHFLDKLGQYGFQGIDNASNLGAGQNWWVDTSNPDLSTPDKVKAFLDNFIRQHGITDLPGGANNGPIFAIVTDAPNGNGFTSGFNQPGPVLAGGATAQMINISSAGGDKDGFTSTFSHEVAERISNTLQVRYPDYAKQTPDPTGAIFGSRQIGDQTQIADGEAGFGRYDVRDQDGNLVQAYWSQSDHAFVIPDGIPDGAPDLAGWAAWTLHPDDANGNPVAGTVNTNQDGQGRILSVELFSNPVTVTQSPKLTGQAPRAGFGPVGSGPAFDFAGSAAVQAAARARLLPDAGPGGFTEMAPGDGTAGAVAEQVHRHGGTSPDAVAGHEHVTANSSAGEELLMAAGSHRRHHTHTGQHHHGQRSAGPSAAVSADDGDASPAAGDPALTAPTAGTGSPTPHRAGDGRPVEPLPAGTDPSDEKRDGQAGPAGEVGNAARRDACASADRQAAGDAGIPALDGSNADHGPDAPAAGRGDRTETDGPGARLDLVRPGDRIQLQDVQGSKLVPAQDKDGDQLVAAGPGADDPAFRQGPHFTAQGNLDLSDTGADSPGLFQHEAR